jgi:hypothetical protein
VWQWHFPNAVPHKAKKISLAASIWLLAQADDGFGILFQVSKRDWVQPRPAKQVVEMT